MRLAILLCTPQVLGSNLDPATSSSEYFHLFIHVYPMQPQIRLRSLPSDSSVSNHLSVRPHILWSMDSVIKHDVKMYEIMKYMISCNTTVHNKNAFYWQLRCIYSLRRHIYSLQFALCALSWSCLGPLLNESRPSEEDLRSDGRHSLTASDGFSGRLSHSNGFPSPRRDDRRRDWWDGAVQVPLPSPLHPTHTSESNSTEFPLNKIEFTNKSIWKIPLDCWFTFEHYLTHHHVWCLKMNS